MAWILIFKETNFHGFGFGNIKTKPATDIGGLCGYFFLHLKYCLSDRGGLKGRLQVIFFIMTVNLPLFFLADYFLVKCGHINRMIKNSHSIQRFAQVRKAFVTFIHFSAYNSMILAFGLT